MAIVSIEKVWVVSCEACIEYVQYCNTKEDAVLVAREHRNSQGHKEWVEYDKTVAARLERV